MRPLAALLLLLALAPGAALAAPPRRAEPENEAPAIRIKAEAARAGAEFARGFAAYGGGDFAAARAAFEVVLAQQPHHSAALAAMAALALRQNQLGEAEAYYRRALEADPKDAWAQAALLNLKAQADPLQVESRLKALAQTQRALFYCHFALGNLYAGQARWSEARRAYQRAVGADPGNPDALFNLAVGFDQLRQPGAAAHFYRQAQAAAKLRPSAIDATALAVRLAALEPAGSP